MIDTIDHLVKHTRLTIKPMHLSLKMKVNVKNVHQGNILHQWIPHI